MPAAVRRVTIRLAIVVLVLAAVLAGTAEVAVTDPHGLIGAPAITAADVPGVQPLYGAVHTPMSDLDWSPDGGWIVLAGGEWDAALLVDARTGGVVRPLQPFANTPPGIASLGWSVSSARWSPNGEFIALGGSQGFPGPGWVYIFSAQGQLLRSWEVQYLSVGGLAWSPDGTKLATSGGGDYAIWDPSTGDLIRRAANASTYDGADWSPDGKEIAFATWNGSVVYNATTGAQIYETHVGNGSVYDQRGVAWSHDGTHLATADEAECAAVFDRTSGIVWQRQFTAFSCGGMTRRTPSWSPDDSMVAVPLSAGVAVLDAATGTTLRVLAFPVDNYGPSDYITYFGPETSRDIAVSWSPQGQAIASTGSMSNPSFRMWGIRRSPLAALGIAFQGTLLVGLPLALGPEFAPLVVGFAGRRRLQDPRTLAMAFGVPFLVVAFVVALLQAAESDLLGRVYGVQVVPWWTWWGLSIPLSALFGLVAVAVGVATFRGWSWPAKESSPGIAWGAAARFYGLAMIPVLWTAGFAPLLISGLYAAGVGVSLEIRSAIVAAAGGSGLILASVALSRIAGLRLPRAAGGLLLSAAVMVAAILSLPLFTLYLLVRLGVNLGPAAGSYGFTIFFDFGLAPLVVGIVVLAVVGVGTFLFLFPPRILAALYTRLTREDVVDLETRRRILTYIETHPGTHFRELLRVLEMGSGNLHYHLYVLEREGFLVPRQDGMYRRFFRSGQPAPPHA